MSADSGVTRDCPRCGASIQGDTKFCPSCGYRLDEPPKAGQGTTGTVRTASQSILQRLVPRKPQPSTQAPSDAVPRVRTASEFTQPVSNWPAKCPNCGFDLKAGAKYCASCGFNVEVWLKRRAMPGGKGSPSYYTSRKRFFSFEGYSLEGVTPAAVMFLIWGLWNLMMSVLALTGGVKVFYPMSGAPPGFETTGLTVGVLFIMGLALLFSAFGLMQVNTILYLVGVIAMIVSVPLSITQIASALTVSLVSGPTGTGQLENLLMGFLGLMISFIGLVQSMRIRKYFFGGES
ncbi:MAG TPA: zinc-ribbon domain-containing protein [Thermoproteota archaeon]|nr:zinc-ribbon domain-containing protein [Thermoproteota archaeon]